MKTILTGLLVLAFAISLTAQDFPRTCGTEMPPRPKYGAGQTNNLVPSLMHNPCLHKSFSIAFFVVLDSNYAWETGLPGATLTPMHIAASIASLNATFGGLCVTFSACVTNTIANYNYNKWKQTSTETEVTDNWYEPKTLNVYLVGGVITPPGPAYTYFPGTGKDILVISKESFRTSPKIFMHQVGHFFGLPDTYAEIGNPVSPGPPPPAGDEL